MTREISTEISPELRHFLRLVGSGKFRGASSGAKAARELARAAVDHSPALDGLARDGFVEFLHVCAAAPETAREVLEG